MTKEVINHIIQIARTEDQPESIKFYDRCNEILQKVVETTVFDPYNTIVDDDPPNADYGYQSDTNHIDYNNDHANTNSDNYN